MGGQIQSPPSPSKITIGCVTRMEMEKKNNISEFVLCIVMSLKVYNVEEKDKIGVRGIDQDRFAADVK
nr:hypothetical protein [Tanacetum cinerariifolium]